VVHQTGEKDLTATRQRYPRMPARWRLEPFLARLWEPLAAADLVVSRAGALTVAELAAAGRPAVLVPFAAAAGGHQLENARALERAGAAVVITENDLTAESLAGTILALVGDRARLAAMGQKARSLARPDAARDLARLVFEAEATR
jgi:UDP-N-acetylglucosamine--N-acetylmuramyl-(pentapeptide) pyrophosphoryl-undecaprenol N-acetylglucosamine transferase